MFRSAVAERTAYVLELQLMSTGGHGGMKRNMSHPLSQGIAGYREERRKQRR